MTSLLGTIIKARIKPTPVPVLLKAKLDLDHAAHQAATSTLNLKKPPTEAQARAGNYPKGHWSMRGLNFSIENPEHSHRRSEWAPLTGHYGYIRATTGADGDQVDAFLKPGTPEDYDGPVYVIDQINADGSFDEHKVMIGWTSQRAAVVAYRNNYPANWPQGEVTELTVDELKEWLDGDTTEPMAKGDVPGHEFHGNQWTGGEDTGGEGPKPGEKFIVYRFGRQGEPLENRNAGNAAAVASHLARVEDIEKPGGVGGTGTHVNAYEVSVTKPFGEYSRFNREMATDAAGSAVGREVDREAVNYSFPKGGAYTARLVGSTPLADLHAALSQRGYSDFDDSGSLIGAEVIRHHFGKQDVGDQLRSRLARANVRSVDWAQALRDRLVQDAAVVAKEFTASASPTSGLAAYGNTGRAQRLREIKRRKKGGAT